MYIVMLDTKSVTCLLALLFTFLVVYLITRTFETFVSYAEYQNSDGAPVLHFDIPNTDFLNTGKGGGGDYNGVYTQIPNTESLELSNIFSNVIQNTIGGKTDDEIKVNGIRDIYWLDNRDDTRRFKFDADVLFTKSLFSVPISVDITLKNVSRFLIDDIRYIVPTRELVIQNTIVNNISVIKPEPFDIRVTSGVVDNLFYIKNKFGLMYPFKTSDNEFVKN
jgi:hypothetical protein